MRGETHDMGVVHVPSVMPRHPKYRETTAAVSNNVAINEPSTFIDAPWRQSRYEAPPLRYQGQGDVPDI